MYSRPPSAVFGFHGCDEAVGRAVIYGETQLRPSQNDFDWLGHGVYFWENAPHRAWQFACEQKKRGVVKNPFVVGTLLDLGRCVNLLDIHHHEALKNAFELYNALFPGKLENMANKGGKDRVLRYLDCTVFEHMHAGMDEILPIDSVRCAFEEGEPSFPGSGILDKTHIQICIRHTHCIKGYFRPLQYDGSPLEFGE